MNRKQLFYQQLDYAVQNRPDSNKIVVLCYNDCNILKHHPHVIRKGRWFYYKNGDKLIYIKIVVVNQPTGEYQRKEPELHDWVREAFEKRDADAAFKIIWKKWEEQK